MNNIKRVLSYPLSGPAWVKRKLVGDGYPSKKFEFEDNKQYLVEDYLIEDFEAPKLAKSSAKPLWTFNLFTAEKGGIAIWAIIVVALAIIHFVGGQQSWMPNAVSLGAEIGMYTALGAGAVTGALTILWMILEHRRRERVRHIFVPEAGDLAAKEQRTSRGSTQSGEQGSSAAQMREINSHQNPQSKSETDSSETDSDSD